MSQAGQTSVVKDIFTTAHERYDFLNHFLSLRRDVGWRRFTVEKMRHRAPGRFLDVATGTADLALEAARKYPALRVTGHRLRRADARNRQKESAGKRPG